MLFDKRKMAVNFPLFFLCSVIFYFIINRPPQSTSTKHFAKIELAPNSVKHTRDNKSNNLIKKISTETKVKGAKLTIIFDSKPLSYSLTKSPLMYNKDFAYSFTLDDGKACAYDYAFPLINGGRNNKINKDFPGLYFSDGCGSRIPFKLGIAMCSTNPKGIDNHVKKNHEDMTWDELKILHHNGWDVLNHSLFHQTGPGTDYEYQIAQNIKYVHEKTNITMTHFVIPGGDTGYTKPAIKLGMKSIYNQKFFYGSNGISTDTLKDLKNYQMYRQFLEEANLDRYINKIDEISTQSAPDNHLWYSAFTHQVGEVLQGGSLAYQTFEDYMNNLELKYGIKGKDNMYMAPLQEVYEYIQTRNLAEPISEQYGDTLLLYLDFSNVPDQRRYQLSLNLNSNEKINKIITEENVSYISYNNENENKLINLKWSSKPQTEYLTGQPPVILGKSPSIFSDNYINAYPNPVSDKLLINIPEVVNANPEIAIVDMKGNCIPVSTYTFTDNNSIEINLLPFNLSESMYYIRIKSGDLLKFSKIYWNKK
jgi:hypothetical protein